MPLNFISDIYNGKISLKEAEFFQRNLEKKIEDLQFLLKGKRRNKWSIDASKWNVFFVWIFKKKIDDAGYNYVLKDVKDFIQETESMSEKINLSLFEDFFESSSPADYTKKLINTSSDENKEIEEEMKNRMSNLKDRMKEMSEKEKKYKNADETLEIIKKILDYNKNAPKYFQLASKVDKKKKKKSKPKAEESIAERVKLKNNKIAEIKKRRKKHKEFIVQALLY